MNNNYELRDIPGYEGRYAATTDGRIWSHIRNIFLVQIYDRYGYLKVNLRKDGQTKTWTVHRLIALTFIPNPEGKATVNHKDEVKTNNNVDNLEWMTVQENDAYGTRVARASANSAKARKKPVQCVETGEIFECAGAAGKAIGLESTNITACCKRKPHCTVGGYHWRYVEKCKKC